MNHLTKENSRKCKTGPNYILCGRTSLYDQQDGFGEIPCPPLGVHGDIFRKTPFHFKVVVLRIVDLINHCFVLVRLTMYTAVDK